MKYYVIFDTVGAEEDDDGEMVLKSKNARAVFETDEPMSYEQIRTLEARQAEAHSFHDCKVSAFFPLESESY
jgi:hypothetical protein